MSEYRHGAHTVFKIHLHPVRTTEYRKPVMTGEVGVRVRALIRRMCGARSRVEIIKGHVSRDHVHLFVSVPPKVTISRLMQMLKGKSSFKLMRECAHLRQKFGGRHLWARGNFCVSSGSVTDEIIKEYIENPSRDQDSDFRVEGE